MKNANYPLYIFRGGGWLNISSDARVKVSFRIDPDLTDGCLGVRLARVVTHIQQLGESDGGKQVQGW